MIKQMFCATVAALMLTTPASALTMTVNQVDRQIAAVARVGQDTENNTEDYNNTSTIDESVFAIEPYSPGALTFGALNGQADVFASSESSQQSGFGPLSIWGEGTTHTAIQQGIINNTPTFAALNSPVQFEAAASSFFLANFSIDAAAEFDFQGLVAAATELTGWEGIDSDYARTKIRLRNLSDSSTVFDYDLTDGSIDIAESGIIGPGTYDLLLSSLAHLRGQTTGEQIPVLQAFLLEEYDQTETVFRGNLTLSEAPDEEPIPEPVTASLSMLGLGALALQTSRRRRA